MRPYNRNSNPIYRNYMPYIYYASEYYNYDYKSEYEDYDDEYFYDIDYKIKDTLYYKYIPLKGKGNIIKAYVVNVIDMESFYPKSYLRNKKIRELLGEIEDTSNTIGNILNHKEQLKYKFNE